MNFTISILIQIILGFFFADIVSGVLHWFEDNYFHYCMKIPLLSTLSKENELHHFFPRDITHSTYIENMSRTVPIVFFLSILIFLIFPKLVLKYKFFLLSFFVFGALSNLIHRFEHERACEKHVIVKLLHKYKILVSSEEHKFHHDNPSCNFCVISPITNLVLEYIQFWKILELSLEKLIGITPNRKPAYNDNVYKNLHTDIHKNSNSLCPRKVSDTDIQELNSILHSHFKCTI